MNNAVNSRSLGPAQISLASLLWLTVFSAVVAAFGGWVVREDQRFPHNSSKIKDAIMVTRSVSTMPKHPRPSPPR